MRTKHRVSFQPASALSIVENQSIDLVVTSPPYPMIEMWDDVLAAQNPEIRERLESGDGPSAFELMHRVLDQVWAECYRALRPGGFACINVGDATRSVAGTFRLYTNHARILSACQALGFDSLPAVLWRKQTNAPNKFMGSGMLPSGAYVTLEHEYILILRKGGKRVFSPAERELRSRSAFFWEERNNWFSDIWDFKGTQQQLAPAGAGSGKEHMQTRQRSGAFPFELAFRLINMYSMQQDLVLDPFLGTGTTTVAAMCAGRSSLGFEIDRQLRPVIESTVAAIAPRLNDRQLERLRQHEQFVARYRETRGHQPKHWNAAHGFAVVTGQEANLVIPQALSVRPDGDGHSPGPAGPGTPCELRYVVEHSIEPQPVDKRRPQVEVEVEVEVESLQPERSASRDPQQYLL